MRRLRWTAPERPVPKHPYRDSAIFYAVLAAIVIVVAAATGYHDLVKAAVLAAIVFVGSTTYSWWYRYDQIKKQRRGEGDRRAGN